MKLFIRVHLDDDHDEELLADVLKKIESIEGVLEAYPCVENTSEVLDDQKEVGKE